MQRRVWKWPYVFTYVIFVISAIPILVFAQGIIELPRTGQTMSYYPGDDGDLLIGVPWPSPRFTDNWNSTITDNLTGLTWTKNANLPGKRTWQEALNYVAGMNSGTYQNYGHTDWRLPNIIELLSLWNPGASSTVTWLESYGFYDVQCTGPEGGPSYPCNYGEYWSSTPYPSGGAFTVDFSSDIAPPFSQTSPLSVWPVRGMTTGPARLWKTGQTKCYDETGKEISCVKTGQDGDIQAGVAWPIPRFIVSGDCVGDNLTGLIWVKNPDNIQGTWEDSLNYTRNLNLCGFNDWRVPNVVELMSLFDYYFTSSPIGPPFIYVHNGFYWSSTTVSSDISYTYIGVADNSTPQKRPKYDTCSEPYTCLVWPVRTGIIPVGPLSPLT